MYYVRARIRKDLENLLQASGVEHEVHSWPTADYRFRIIMGSEDLLKVIVTLTATLDYPNFKNCVAQQPDQRDMLDAYHEIWATMSDFQCEEAVR